MLKWRSHRWLICAAFAVTAISRHAPARAAEVTPLSYFADHVAPLLAGHCVTCHQGPEPKGGLDLSHRDTAMRGGESGRVLVAGQVEQSLLWAHVNADEMPPDQPLAPAEKLVLSRWIDEGLAWDVDPIDVRRYTTDRRAGFDWWSLQPLSDPDPPEVGQVTWVRNDIDRFILRRLEAAGIAPAAQADPRNLARRLYYDLIGLPPTPAQLESFLKHPTDAAYEQLVDELLASPYYGERWGRHWLDVVRFGESDGFERNAPREGLWPYRDWVIQALNNDISYTEFVRQQLAGDVLQPGPQGAAAVGFLVSGVHNTVVGSSERMKRLRASGRTRGDHWYTGTVVSRFDRQLWAVSRSQIRSDFIKRILRPDCFHRRSATR